MIYTCTTNPSLDYYMSFETIEPGKNNRSDMEMFDAGGKGVNVSIMLNNFHIASSCLGFLGGFTKDFYLKQISNYPNIQPLFTTIKDNTRINLKLMDSNNETSLNARGPKITNEEFEKFRTRLNSIYSGDYFVISGNIEKEIEKGIIDCIYQLSNDGVKVVIDVDDYITEKCIDCKPFLVKLNDYYFLNKNESLQEVARIMLDKGVKYVLYSNAGKPSYLFTKNITLKCESLANNLINTTGSSDSLVAGLLYGLIRGADPIESFKYANAASLATTLSNDLGSKDKIEEIFDTIEVQSI